MLISVLQVEELYPGRQHENDEIVFFQSPEKTTSVRFFSGAPKSSDVSRHLDFSIKDLNGYLTEEGAKKHAELLGVWRLDPKVGGS